MTVLEFIESQVLISQGESVSVEDMYDRYWAVNYKPLELGRFNVLMRTLGFRQDGGDRWCNLTLRGDNT